MRVMVFAKATEGMSLGEPTPEALEAFAAMDRYTEELVKAGVFVAAAGLRVSSIKDITPIPHNGCRPPKRRRI